MSVQDVVNRLDRGLCFYCDRIPCRCNDLEPPVFRDKLGYPHDAVTGRIVSEKRARELEAEDEDDEWPWDEE